MLVYILIKKDKYLKEIKTFSCADISILQKHTLAIYYNVDEEDIIITKREPEYYTIKELGLEIEPGFRLEGTTIKEMTIQEKIDNGIIKLKENEVVVNGEIYTLKTIEKFVDKMVIEKTYQEKYNDGLITKEEYNEEVRKEREREYSKTDDMYNKLTIRYNLKELTEQEYQEGLEEIKKEKEKIKEELPYLNLKELTAKKYQKKLEKNKKEKEECYKQKKYFKLLSSLFNKKNKEKEIKKEKCFMSKKFIIITTILVIFGIIVGIKLFNPMGPIFYLK